MTETTEEIATDPKARGKLQALRGMLDDLQNQIAEITRKLAEQAGAKAASERIAASMAGVADLVRTEGEANGLDVADVKTRVALVLKCREAATAQVGDAGKERALLQGEARALGRQVESIRKMHAAAVAEEQRKARVAAEDRALRERNEAKPKPKRKAPAKRKTGTKKAAAKRTPAKGARTPAKSRKTSKGAK
jgi:hypothetical protein